MYSKEKNETSLTLKAAPPLESPSSFVKMAPVIPISTLNVVTNAAVKKYQKVKEFFNTSDPRNQETITQA